MNVLSLFGGIEAGCLALKMAGVPVANYFSSEIDKHAIQCAKKNHPEIIHLGDIRNWKKWNLPKIDLVIGGSPCQNLSKAGDGTGLEGKKSSLFWYYIEILKALKPEYFFFENVVPAKKDDLLKMRIAFDNSYEKRIDAKIVLPAARDRIYFTNIMKIPHGWWGWTTGVPDMVGRADGGPFLYEILEDEVPEKYYMSEKATKRILSRVGNGFVKIGGEKSCTIKASDYAKWNGQYITDRLSRQYRPKETSGKGMAICASTGGFGSATGLYFKGERLRKLTEWECARCLGFPDNYTAGLSLSQQYRLLGLSWAVPVIVHFFRHLRNKL